jgi:cullin 1
VPVFDHKRISWGEQHKATEIRDPSFRKGVVSRIGMEMEQGWHVLYQRILKLRRILEGDSGEKFLSDELVDTYTIVHNIDMLRPAQLHSQQLYDRYKGSLEEYMAVILADLINKNGEAMLKELMKRWENHNVMVQTLSDWFRILDGYFVKANSLTPLRKLGLVCFREHVYHEIKANVKNAVLNLIHNEREGERIDGSLLKNVLLFFLEIGMDDGMDLYKNDFEAHMFEDTLNYYSRKAALWIPVDSFTDYMRMVEDCLKREEDSVAHYLHYSSKERLLEIVRNELLSHYPTRLVENEHSGLPTLLRDNKKHDLSRMYRLFCKISNGLDTISNSFIQQLATAGRTIVKQAEEDAAGGMQQHAFVRKVIELHDRYMEYVEDAFQNNYILGNHLKQAFQVICGKAVGGSTFAEILAIFCDNLLNKSKGGGKLSQCDVENMLEKVVKLLVYIDDKDIFGEVYRKKLAARSLSDESIDFTIEETMLTKLKEQNGSRFTSKMEGMIKDLMLLKEESSNFKDYVQSQNIDLRIELRVKVLSTKCWSTFQFSQPNLPSDIVNSVEVFKAYYSRENKNRKLTWIYSLGTCNISGKFDNTKIEMIVTTYQAIILLLFNDHDKLSYAEIKSKLNLTDEDVAKQLHSMSCLKYKILVKQPNTKMVANTDIFEVNPNFTSKSKRIRIPFSPFEGEEKKKVIDNVQNDRKDAIDAMIVRIMKSRKVLHDSDLVSECINQHGNLFKPDVKVIEGRIEFLICKDFLKRDEENSRMLKYVA